MISRTRICLKPVSPVDLPSVLAVYRQCEDFLALGPEPAASLDMVHRDLDHSRSEGGRFCAIHDPSGGMVGIVDYIPDGFEGDPSRGFISLLMIALPFRKMGIGREVVGLVEAEIIRNPRVCTIWSAVQVNNPAAIRFWLRLGYRIDGQPERQPDETTVFRLRKEMRPLSSDPS